MPLGQEKAQTAIKPMLRIPEQLSVLDIFLFGPPAQTPYKRWRKPLAEIMNRDRLDSDHVMTDEDLDDWIKTRSHRVMYKNAAKID